MEKALLIGAVLLTLGGIAWAARRGALNFADVAGEAVEPVAEPEVTTDNTEPFSFWTQQNQNEAYVRETMPEQLPQPSANVPAFLAMIRKSEGTAGQSDPWAVCFGYKHTIQNFADHPAITGEWRGEPLSAAMCAGAGLGPGCVSTAAGAYQIIKPTWLNVKKKLGLPDFSPASQDAAAIELIRQRGGLGFVESGQFSQAVNACRKEWASLTGAGYGQGERSLPWLQARFIEAGGVLA